MIISKNNLINFILRRAVWRGEVKRFDILSAFPVSNTTATSAMDDAVVRYPKVLRRDPKAVSYIRHAELPYEASAERMLQLMESGHGSYSESGLDEHELQVRFAKFPPSRPLGNDSLELIMRALIGEYPLDILYAGLRRGESARWRAVLPTAFERFKNQWRLIAHDLEQKTYPERSFVFARILGAKAVPDRKKPRALKLATGFDSDIKLTIKLNPLMTDDQKKAVMNELGIDQHDRLVIPSRSLHDFKRYYTPKSLDNNNITWPLIAEIKEEP
ncbi:MAG: hypothetical protein FD164_535 [Nitrospirae bacterium]|nr:MAG: hypothetical protein FD164_535 [Nitrospirota bacterium]